MNDKNDAAISDRLRNIILKPEVANRMRDALKDDNVTEGPKPTGKPPEELTLTGSLIAYIKGDDEPILLAMPGSSFEYLPVFTTHEKLLAVITRVIDTSAVIHTKLITDGPDFLDSIPSDIKVIVDPYFLPNGRVRFVEVQRKIHSSS